MRLRHHLNLYSDHRKQWGSRRALFWAVMTLLQRLGISINYVFVGADRDDLKRSRPAPPVPSGYETRLATPQDFVGLDEQDYRFDPSMIDRAFANNDSVAITLFQGKLVAYRCRTTVEAPVTEQLKLRVPDGFEYAYMAWVHADHRRRNLDAKAVWVLNQHSPKSLSDRSIWYIAVHNYPSLLHRYEPPGQRRLRMGLVGWYTVFGKQVPFASRRAKWLGFEFEREHSRPRQYTY